jgi:hypothetical protein
MMATLSNQISEYGKSYSADITERKYTTNKPWYTYI